MKTKVKLLLCTVLFLSLCNTSLLAAPTEWAKSFGGTDDDQPYATAVDANGNLFMLTQFKYTCDFDPNTNKTANVSPTSLLSSVAVSKYDANGNFLWVKSFSANTANGGTVHAGTMVLDKAGNIYFGGEFSGTTDFNPDPVAVANLTPEAISATYDGLTDAYVCKLDNDGKFVWVKQFRGDLNQDILEISVDEVNNVFISCSASGSMGIQTDFNPDPTATAILTNSSSNQSMYIVKLDAAGNYAWTKQLRGTGDRYCYGIKTDKDGNLYLGGHFKATIYPDPTNKTTLLSTSDNDPVFGTTDLFFIKWDANGSYEWSKRFGGTSYDVFGSMEIDPVSTSIYISGDFFGTVDFNMNSLNKKTLSTTGNNDGFLAKYDAAGNCDWAKQFGGAGQDKVESISLDALGNVFIGGSFAKTANLNAGASNLSFTSAGNKDAFVAKLDNLGNFKWAKQIGGMGNDWVGGLAATGDGNVFAAGVFTFEATVNDISTTLTAVDGYDAWMYKSSATTDIKVLQMDAKISIYPNPTFGKAVLNLNNLVGEVTVSIRSAVGGQISSQSYNDATKVELSFPKASGLYLVELKDAKGRVQTLKVLKK